MNELIAVIDDEQEVLELVASHLEKAFFKPETFQKAATFFNYLQDQNKPDLIILDIQLKDGDGFEICKMLKNNKAYADIPIIIITSKNEESERILGLELGADDYVVKPFFPKELAARVKVVLKRGQQAGAGAVHLSVGDIEIDLEKYVVTVGGDELDLTTTEFKILELLAKRPGIVYSRDQILDYLWGDDKFVIGKTVDVHIKNLRKKLGDAGKLITNVRSVGYKISAR